MFGVSISNQNIPKAYGTIQAELAIDSFLKKYHLHENGYAAPQLLAQLKPQSIASKACLD
jgi:hypothetical protein